MRKRYRIKGYRPIDYPGWLYFVAETSSPLYLVDDLSWEQAILYVRERLRRTYAPPR
jgi:hypothetical protein